MTNKLIAAAAFALAVSAAPCFANDGAEATVEHIGYADLNLQHPAAVAALNARVSKAIERVCNFEPGQKGKPDFAFRNCSKRAWLAAAPQVGRALGRQFGANGIELVAAAPIRITAR